MNAVDRTGNSYCGPLVLAAIMGCTSAEAANRVRAVRGLKVVKGTLPQDLWCTLRAHGYRSYHEYVPQRYINARKPGKPGTSIDTVALQRCPQSTAYRVAGVSMEWMPGSGGLNPVWGAPYTPIKLAGPTLAEWMRSKRDPDAYYVVGLSDHWVLVKGRKFIDTFTKGQWVFLRSAPHRRKRVRSVFRVECLK